ncbi:uncharacterized protein PV09_03933 [Verruconis gallopava]|uniref:NAD(P)-binding protein n=1 Tax=Verruconis gallopava TaxID=253628 RepID=A0A0D2AEK8_9PEZI|nr:uncharacterized protein PV09_03933 [Verruconis gallopava]KIW05423.1 hypothetical protein PV09_03933 [Verruconis gallopava]
MPSTLLDIQLFANIQDRVAIVTGAAGGIGAETVRLLHANGAKVVLVDLPVSRSAAQNIISELSDPRRAHFIPGNIANWNEMKSGFKAAIERFGRLDVVIANAGVMESTPFYQFEVDEAGDLKEPIESYSVIDTNLKGTMNTLRLAIFHMSKNSIDPVTKSRGSILLVASTSGYFGGTAVVSYISSKHGVIGLLRSSQKFASEHNIRVNAVAPFVTPTFITSGYSEKWKAMGLPANTTSDVAKAIVKTAGDETLRGCCYLVAGQKMVEIEKALDTLTSQWIGEEMLSVLVEGGKFFDELGGYPLPPSRS